MTKDEIRRVVLEALKAVAPELEENSLEPDKSLRDQLDIDSMDFLNYVIGLHETLKIEIPEVDYPKLSTLGGAVAYIVEHLGVS